MYLHIALYVVILGTVFLNRRLSFSLRAAIIVIICFLLGVAGLVAWGLAAFGLLALFCFCLLSTILFGARAGIISAVVSIVIIGIIGTFAHAGILSYKINAEIYLSSATTWLSAIIAMALSAGIIVIALGTLNRQVEGLIDTLEKQNDDGPEWNRTGDGGGVGIGERSQWEYHRGER